jgi:hypothetical protein
LVIEESDEVTVAAGKVGQRVETLVAFSDD